MLIIKLFMINYHKFIYDIILNQFSNIFVEVHSDHREWCIQTKKWCIQFRKVVHLVQTCVAFRLGVGAVRQWCIQVMVYLVYTFNSVIAVEKPVIETTRDERMNFFFFFFFFFK